MHPRFPEDVSGGGAAAAESVKARRGLKRRCVLTVHRSSLLKLLQTKADLLAGGRLQNHGRIKISVGHDAGLLFVPLTPFLLGTLRLLNPTRLLLSHLSITNSNLQDIFGALSIVRPRIFMKI